MTDNFTRYIVPNGGGIADHPSGLLYRREEVDPVVDALRARILADEQALKEANEVIKAAVVLAGALDKYRRSGCAFLVCWDDVRDALDAFHRAMQRRKGGE